MLRKEPHAGGCQLLLLAAVLLTAWHHADAADAAESLTVGYSTTEVCEDSDTDDAEAELLRVELLQTSVRLGHQRSASPLGSDASHARPPGGSAGQVPVLQGQKRHTQGNRIMQAVPWDGPDATAAEVERMGVTMAQTELVLTYSGGLVQNGESRGHQQLEPRTTWSASTAAASPAKHSTLASVISESLAANGLPHFNLPREHALGQNIVVFYLMMYFGTLACIAWYLQRPVEKQASQCRDLQHTRQRQREQRPIEAKDAEQLAWDQGILHWVSVSWANTWVARWGEASGTVQVQARDLPQLGNADHQARSCSKVFAKLWSEEFRLAGKDSSLFRIMIRVWTVRSMVQLMGLLVCQILIGQVCPAFIVQEALGSFHRLRGHASRPLQESSDLAGPLAAAIAAFSALPLLSTVLASAGSTLSCRLDQRLCGGLSIAVFEKAQRLPKYRFRLGDAGEASPRDESCEGKEDPIDLAALVGYDIHGSLLGCYHHLCTSVGSAAAALALVALLFRLLRLAVLGAAACALPVVLVSLYMSTGLGRAMHLVQERTDRRIRALREVLHGIRVVKCQGWEEAVEERISELRSEEVAGLRRYYGFLGGFMGIFLGFPRFLLLAGLWGYCSFYGHHDVANIFTCVQILASLKCCCDALARSLGRAVTVGASLRRVEAFLKLPELPFLASEGVPPWVDLWPSPQGFGPRGPAAAEASLASKEVELRLRGSFRFNEESPAVLHDLELNVPHGSLVAVIGAAGAGKSALLQAVLGEMHPVLVEDISVQQVALSRPEVVAYCPQAPYIGNGNIQENILFGQCEDEERYAAALRAAGLEPDLRRLPGGDQMPVGPRGVALSASQRALVALARAGYCRGAPLVVLDDPFASLDAPAAAVVVERLLHGHLMKDRTRLVVLQAQTDLLRRFDRIVVMAGGRIIEQGPAEAVLQTAAFVELERAVCTTSPTAEVPVARAVGTPPAPTNQQAVAAARRATVVSDTSRGGMPRVRCREDGSEEGRPTWAMLRQYCQLGRWRNIINASILFCVQVTFCVFCDLLLAHWTNALALNSHVNDELFLRGYLLWLSFGLLTWLACWKFGEWFTLRISSKIHDVVLGSVLRAPLDHFFDQHPVGRVMNRLSADLAVVDLFLFMKSTGTMAVTFQTLIPLVYVHLVMPWFVLILALPLYYLIWALSQRYWSATIPLRYCVSGARARLNSLLSDVASYGAIMRAFQDQQRITAEMCTAVDEQLRACLHGERTLRRWLVFRIILLWSFFTTATYLICLMNPVFMGVGTLGLAMTSLLLLQSQLEQHLDQVTGAQSEFVALARIHGYVNIVQEKPRELFGDGKYRDFSVRISRQDLRKSGELTLSARADQNGAVQVLRAGKPILESTPCGTTLVAAGCSEGSANATGDAAHLLDLCPSCPILAQAESWHRIVAVGSKIRNAEAMASELCSPRTGDAAEEEQADEDGKTHELVLEIRSAWLVDGAGVVLDTLKAGYGDIPYDVLQDVSFCIGPRERVGIIGPSGAGKSSLLLALLRVLELRGGKVLLSGVDSRHIGLSALRNAFGLLPQEPLVFSGSLRDNIDPFAKYHDERVWKAAAAAHLAGFAEGTRNLDAPIDHEGTNLSLGQRHLVCLARMILRQPAVLLQEQAMPAVDLQTQELLQQSVRCAFPFSTLIAVSRRLDIALDLDRVVLLQQGRVVDEGPPTEVAQKWASGLSPVAEDARERS